MAHEHPSGIPAAYDRSPAKPNWTGVVVREDRIAQGAEINEVQSIIARRERRVGDLVAKDGDRISGADLLVDKEAESLRLSAGRIYASGDVRPVPAATFADVPMTGEVIVGVRLQSASVSHEDDPDLVGLHPGSEAEGEPGAHRLIESLVWALSDDAQDGEFFGVYLIVDGDVIDQQPPPALSGVVQQIARYDYDALGHYIVDGCEIAALGKIGPAQVFSVAAGTANILGFKRIREASIRHVEEEQPDLEAIAAEPHTFDGPSGGQATIPVSRAPIATVTAAVVVKQVTESVVRGAVPGSTDALTHPSVVSIVSVVQGGTTYVATTDYQLAGDGVSWAPAGAEPAGASTYTVTYRYNATVAIDEATPTHVKVTGGVNGTTALISYTSKLPRIDILCLDVAGRPVYVKGLSSRRGRLPPPTPSTLLKIAEIRNDWLTLPVVVNNGTRNYTFDEQRRLFSRLIDVLDQFSRSEAERDVLARAPVAKNGIFTDAFVDDFFRDQGAAQTAAVNRGVLQLAIDNVLMQRAGTAIETLPFIEEIVVRQDQRTSAMLINPYDNFSIMPGALTLEPAADFWTEETVSWTSPVTREFTTAPNEPPGQTTINEVTEIRRSVADTLRPIAVQATIAGFGGGENLAALTIDGVDVKPAGTQTANGSGALVVTFNIPAGVPAGRRIVRAEGAAGSFAQAIFVGEGTIDAMTMRRVTLVARAAPVPLEVTNVTIINNITQPIIQEVTPASAGGAVADVGGGPGGGVDPLAQTFTLTEPRHVVGVNFRFAAIGDRAKGVRVQLATVLNGFPTRDVLAECFLSMATPEIGDLIEARFRAPVFLPADREFCFVILTTDPDHAVDIARLGDVDAETQRRVSAQPYTVGVLLSSANRLTWTPHQDADLHFQIVAAKFTATARTINLWTGPINTISDLQVRGSIDIPTAAARFHYEIVRADASVIRLAPGQTHEFADFVTETITLRAVLAGSEKVSPTLYPATLLAGGRIRTTGTYITRRFTMGSAVEITALFGAFLPAGATVAVHCDAGDGSWVALTAGPTGVLGGGWTEPKFTKTPFTAAEGRVRVTLNGGPGARAAIARLRAYSV